MYKLCDMLKKNCSLDFFETPSQGLFQKCININGTYECQCPRGYRYTESKCTDIDECQSEKTYTCDEQAKCENFIGGYGCKERR